MLVLDEKKILQYYIDKVDLESNPIVPSIHILLESVSTNSEMKDFLKQGVLPEGAVFLTDYQTAGRGRQGKSFYSPRGMGLYFSIFTRPKDKQGNAILITTHAAVAVVRAIEELYGISLSIKWVNDLFTGKKNLWHPRRRKVLLRCVHCEDRLEFYERKFYFGESGSDIQIGERFSAAKSKLGILHYGNRNQSIYSPRRLSQGIGKYCRLSFRQL